MSEAKKYKHPNLESWLIPRLRRLTYQWPARAEAKRRSRVDRGLYKCAHCERLFGPKQVHMDHQIPIVDPEKGSEGILAWITRAFVLPEGFNTLCIECHDLKTRQENEKRTKPKRKKTK